MRVSVSRNITIKLSTPTLSLNSKGDYLSICLSTYLSIYLSILIYRSTYLSIYLSTYLSIYLSPPLEFPLQNQERWVLENGAF